MKFAVIVFPGSNCDHDVYHALKLTNGENVEFVWHREGSLKGVDAVILPGGFSYGDYLRAGAIARFSPIMKEVIQFAQKSKIVVGICNGFQVLTECGLLPGSLMRNSNLRFICKHIYIRTETNNTKFTRKLQTGQVIKIPIAHGEGNYFADESDLKQLEDNQQIVFRYSSSRGEVKPEFNPNGSTQNIAGIINREGNVLGIMPHPERVVENIVGVEDGRWIFESLCA